jgi:hypothetical protein
MREPRQDYVANLTSGSFGRLVFHCNVITCPRFDNLTLAEHVHTFVLVASRSLDGLPFSLFKWLTQHGLLRVPTFLALL